MTARTSEHQPPAELLNSLKQAQSLVCVGHVSPDADCLGAALALTRAWSQSTKKTASIWVSEDSIPARLQFLFDIAQVPRTDGCDTSNIDRTVIVDTSQPSRADVPDALPSDWCDRQNILNIDHHFTNTCFGKIDWIVENASSTCELIYHVVNHLQFKMDAVVATLLYAGIYTDTGGFSLPNTTTHALHVAAELTRRGASPADIAERVDRSVSNSQFDLLKRTYQNTQTLASGMIAYSTISHDDLTRTGCNPSDIDDQVDVPRSMAGVAIAALFTEVRPGKVRINLRGESSTEVAGLAQQFGGGGHRQAAGVIYSGALEDAVEQVMSAAVKLLATESRNSSDRCEPTEACKST